MARDTSTICLFDVDGTLTLPRQQVSREIEDCLQKLNKKVVVGLVGGSDLVKISEQMKLDGKEVIDRYDYVFSENGLLAHKNGQLYHKESILSFMGEEKIQELINFALHELSKIKLPCKRGNFVEFRTGLINICPVGRSCSQEERDQFGEFDKVNHVRKQLVEKMREKFTKDGFIFAIGGQISFDVFPVGWDKRYCIKHLEKENFKTIHFFGDKTNPGGNDHEIYSDSRTIGHSVTSPKDTIQQLNELFSF